MKALTIEFPDPLYLELSREARKRKVSAAQVVIDRVSMKPAGSAPTLWERMEDLVIHDDDLPKDLSSNKKHLKGYGRNHTR